MNEHTIRAPFFEIGPKSYLYGQEVVDLAIAADQASEKYGVDIIFTTPIVSISAVKAATKHIHVFAPHMDPLEPGRGLADILPESLVAAGAEGVMLNHVEKPLTLGVLKKTIERAKEVDLTTIGLRRLHRGSQHDRKAEPRYHRCRAERADRHGADQWDGVC